MYTFQSLQQRFSYPAVDSLVFKENPLLHTTKNPHDMQLLCKSWRKAVLNHPWLYLKHRAINMRYVLISSPGLNYTVQDVPWHLVNDLSPQTLLFNAANIGLKILFFIFMSHLPTIILGVGYFIIAVRYWHKIPSARILGAFSAAALLMVGLLFFLSMAGTPRYTYVSILLINAAHIFAYATLTNARS